MLRHLYTKTYASKISCCDTAVRIVGHLWKCKAYVSFNVHELVHFQQIFDAESDVM